MDFLEKVGLEIFLALVGSFLIVLGLTDGVSAFGFGIAIPNESAKIISFLTGVTIIIVSVVVYLRGEPSIDIDQEKGVIRNVTSDDFFFTLDSPRAESFHDMVSGARRVKILARTVVNLVGQYKKDLERLINQGCELQILLVDPNCDAAKYLYGNRHDVYLNNVELTKHHISHLNEIGRKNFQVKMISAAPTMGMVSIEKEKISASFLQVQLYFLHGAVGRDRPVFRVSCEDKWYNVFVEEFDELWATAEDWS